MAEVVGQRDGLRQVLVEIQRPGHRAGDLRHLDGMGQTGPVVVALVVDEDLGLVLQAPEGGGMDDAVAIALKGGAGRAHLLGIEPAAALFRMAGIGRENSRGAHGATLGRTCRPRNCDRQGFE